MCPGPEVNLIERAKLLFPNDIKVDHHVGRYISTYTGYSNNEEMRFLSTSGGLLSQFLIYMLDKNIIDGAIVTGNSSLNPLDSHTYIARTSEDILRAKGSKYSPVSMNGIISEIKGSSGKYIVVGLPCHIEGFRKYEQLHKSIQKKILGYISLFCSGVKKYPSQEYLLNAYKVDSKDIKDFTYRTDGCLGSMKITNNDGSVKKIPYREYHTRLRGFFTPSRCMLCVDHYGELADMSIGDIHIGEYKNDNIGVNSIIVRNSIFHVHLLEAEKSRYLSLAPVSVDTVKESQIYVYKHQKGPGVEMENTIRRILGKPVPNYGYNISDNYSIKYFARFLRNSIFRKIGTITQLWFIIDLIDIISKFGKKLKSNGNSNSEDEYGQ